MIKMMVVLASLLSFSGCQANLKPGDRIVSFSLSNNGGMRYESGYEYDIRETEDGKVLFSYNKERSDEKEFYLDDRSVFDTLDQIVRKYKMNRYKSNYRPWGNVKDGKDWSLSVKYASGKEIDSKGYVATPRNWNEAEEELLKCLGYWKDQAIASTTDTITYFSLSEGGGMNRFSGFRYVVSKTKEGQVHFHFNEHYPDEKEFTLDDHSVFDSLQRIVQKYKMYNYAGFYEPEFDITDGQSWHLDIYYASGNRVHANGYMAGPEGYGAAFREVRQCLEPWKELPAANNEILDFLYEYGPERYRIEPKEDHAVIVYDNAETGAHQELEWSTKLLENLQIFINVHGFKMDQTRGNLDFEYTPWMYEIHYTNGDHYRYESYDRDFQSGYTEWLQGFVSYWMDHQHDSSIFYY